MIHHALFIYKKVSHFYKKKPNGDFVVRKKIIGCFIALSMVTLVVVGCIFYNVGLDKMYHDNDIDTGVEPLFTDCKCPTTFDINVKNLFGDSKITDMKKNLLPMETSTELNISYWDGKSIIPGPLPWKESCRFKEVVFGDAHKKFVI